MTASDYSIPVMRSLTFLALTTSAAVAAGQQPDRPRCRDCAPVAEGRAAVEARAAQVRDSLSVRGVAISGDIERLAMQLLSSRQVQVEAQQALQALTSGQIAEGSRAEAEIMARRLRLQFDQATRQSQSLRAQLAALCDRNTKPEGFVGITVSAEMTADAGRSGMRVFRFAENPTVETVEPGSPAERAGVTKGDEILLIGGQPVVGRDVLFTRLQRPGSRLPIRIRRDGDTRDVTLIVGEPLKSVDNSCPFLDARIMAAFGDPFTVATPMPPLGIVRVGPRNGVVIARSPAPPTPETPAPTRAPGGSVSAAPPAPIVPSVPLPPPVQAWVRGSEPVFTFTGTPAAPMVIAGATIIRTNADLRETFGVKSGVLVLDVARGSPAYNSGLRGGDIIVSAGRGAVTSPLSIQRAIEVADGSEVPLKIIRKKKEHTLVLRWQPGG